MNVELCWHTIDMEPGKIRRAGNFTVKEATAYFNDMQDIASVKYAYLRRFDGWQWHHYKWLKKKEKS